MGSNRSGGPWVRRRLECRKSTRQQEMAHPLVLSSIHGLTPVPDRTATLALNRPAPRPHGLSAGAITTANQGRLETAWARWPWGQQGDQTLNGGGSLLLHHLSVPWGRRQLLRLRRRTVDRRITLRRSARSLPGARRQCVAAALNRFEGCDCRRCSTPPGNAPGAKACASTARTGNPGQARRPILLAVR